ncbi:hypothetical protein [Bradyrhizobium genosp. P]|uniref:hypothetical protein n=1 Tax=Bradyrhizobium genosp. P TaxID=83641 RepID=UPI003CE6EAE3
MSETVELNSNQFLRPTGPFGTAGSYSTITTEAQARTPASRLILDGDITYQKYWGPGTEPIPQTEFRQDGVKARYEVKGKEPTDLTYGEVSFRESSTALAVLSNLGVATTAAGFIDTSTIRGGIERNLTNLDFATFSARSTYTSYDPSSGGTPFTDSSALGTWKHRLNSNLAIVGSSELEWLSFNNASSTNIMILREMAGVDAILSPTLSFRGTIGPAYLQANQNSVAASPLPPASAPTTSGSVTDFLADIVLTYRMLKNTTLALTGNQTIGPSVIGSLTKQTTIGASLTELVNSRSSLSFGLSASRQITTTSSDFYSASVTYSYQLAREWNSQITYRHLHRTAASGSGGAVFDPATGIPIVASAGSATSDSIMLVLTRNFTVLPSSTVKN